MSLEQTCPACGCHILATEGMADVPRHCASCQQGLADDSATVGNEAAEDFADMLQYAARDQHATGTKVSLQQAHSGSISLLAAAGLYLALILLSLFPRGWEAFTELGDFVLLAITLLYLPLPLIFAGLYLWACRDPYLPILIGLVLYCLFLLPSLLLVPWLFTWLIESVILVTMIDALRAGLHYRRRRRQALTNPDWEDPAG